MYCVQHLPLQSEPHTSCRTDKETDRILAVFATNQIKLFNILLKFINFLRLVSVEDPVLGMDGIAVMERQ